ncbi:VWA domain-containing protein [Candidatus Bathyarchaeota archaeon]|nr:VWA domain-containing protein [Candidatus Bathyarchaeota archaeon]
MDFFDFAWSTAVQITKMPSNKLKILLHDELRYPYLGRDNAGFVLHLVKPRRLENNAVYFQGLKLNLQDPTHKKLVWHMFKASVYHLNLHLHLSDFSLYSGWARDKHSSLSTFVISLVEDATICKHLRRSFEWMLPEIAYANTISFLRMKNTRGLSNRLSRIMSSILLNFNLGKVKGDLNEEMLLDVQATTSILQKMGENPTIDEKLEAAKKIYDALAVYGETFEVPSLLYTESHGTNDLFYEQSIPKEEEIQPILPEALTFLNPEMTNQDQLKTALQSLKENEAQQVLTRWVEYENAKLKILKGFAEIGKDTRFEDFEFPVENYADYLRKRTLLSSPIRRVLHQLRLLKNVGGEDFRQESGFIDLQEAIQVIASKSQRTDIFAREELQTREDAWSILIDASHSLNMFHGEVRDIAVCLAEVAKTLILDQNSWGMYAFNSKFYVIKDFTERYNTRVKARIGGLTHGGFTYLPDAVWLAAQALTKRIQEARVLVVVSDFFPAGYDEAEEKLRENIKKIERTGVGIIGIGVNSRAVKQYTRTSCVVEGPYDLMKKFTKAFVEYSSG